MVAVWCGAVGALLLTSGPLAVPAGAQGEPASGDAATADHADAGERQADLLAPATPEEIEERRAGIAARIAEAGGAAELARRTELEAAAAIEELDTQLADRQAEVAAATEASADAAAVSAEAGGAEQAAKQAAREADRRLQEAAVDMFINPPQADGMRAALTGTVEEELASSGLLAGRAEGRSLLVRRAERARAAATKASKVADDAAAASRDAEAAAEEAVAAVEADLEARNSELLRIRSDLAALVAELGSLQLTDTVLASRLYLDALAGAGSATAVLQPDGTWKPVVQGLPTQADMRLVPGTTMWVHHLVFDAVTAMVMAAAADGVTLGGSAFRDTQRQIELRRSHCGASFDAIFNAPSSSCAPPTARPGMSMHERGLALDLTEGGSTLTRSSAAFAWLSEHAAEYGFFNLPSEPWHWSVNGR